MSCIVFTFCLVVNLIQEETNNRNSNPASFIVDCLHFPSYVAKHSSPNRYNLMASLYLLSRRCI